MGAVGGVFLGGLGMVRRCWGVSSFLIIKKIRTHSNTVSNQISNPVISQDNWSRNIFLKVPRDETIDCEFIGLFGGCTSVDVDVNIAL